ncbi:glycosyltransferase [Comamonas sp. lk]|uniref:glycosyltransferase n=1 Tax=Comamonas sp. lk TaxID=2201272 RepID=UPI000EB39525|nr:glycosyltransferase [Comamonas sp. lk]
MTLLQQANHAMQGRDYAAAIALYVRALQQCAPLAPVLQGNLHRAQKAYRAQRTSQGGQEFPRVLVSSWDLSLNATGRATTLAQIWAGIGRAEVIGCLYPQQKSQIWEPLQDFPLSIHPLYVATGQSFVQQALDFVLAHPCDLLHLSKPRWPNILLGLLYKLVWACPVLMDVDDEELAFAKAISPVTLEEYLQTTPHLPNTPSSLRSATSTRLGVGLTKVFDGITTVNPALQQRYGGSIVHHARDAAQFAPSTQRRSQARARLGIDPGHTVILFAGTPRAHKGLLETAQAIAEQRHSDLVFLIAGDFPDNLSSLKQQIASLPDVQTIMLPNQCFQTLPDTLAAGDICVLLQDMDSVAAQYQTPAKLTDALAMGLTVLATPTPALADLAAQGAFTPVPPGQLPQVLAATLAKRQNQRSNQPVAHPLFEQFLTTTANQVTLYQLWQKTLQSSQQELNTRLLEVAALLPGICLLASGIGEGGENG